MNDKSPLFVSTLELLAHATELYSLKNPKKYKFIILHLANAIELILKDLLVNKGVSIYKPKSNQTLDIWTAFDELSKVGVKIKERPVIELLVDDRNTIQHRFGFPNAEAVYYYLDQVIAFFVRLFDDEYHIKFSEVISLYLTKEQLALIGFAEDEFEHLNRLAKVSPESAVIQVYNDVILELKTLMDSYGLMATQSSLPPLRTVLNEFNYLVEEKKLNSEILEDFKNLLTHRNIAAHKSDTKIEEEEWLTSLEAGKRIVQAIRKLLNDK